MYADCFWWVVFTRNIKLLPFRITWLGSTAKSGYSSWPVVARKNEMVVHFKFWFILGSVKSSYQNLDLHPCDLLDLQHILKRSLRHPLKLESINIQLQNPKNEMEPNPLKMDGSVYPVKSQKGLDTVPWWTAENP